MIVFDRPTVFVLRALGLGDLLTGVPALRALRRAHPDHRVVLATSNWLRPLVGRLDFVDGLWPTDEIEPLQVRFTPNDVAVNLHGRGPGSTHRLLEAEPSRLLAFFHPDIPATFGAPMWKRGEHETRRWCRLLMGYDIPADPSDLSLPVPPDTDRSAVVVHPGASAPARLWPPDKWAYLVRLLSESGEPVVITGGKGEVALAREIALDAQLPSESVLAGELAIDGLADLISGARLLVSSDTGPAHLATAFATPSVVLFGPTSPSEWGPPADGPHRVIWRGPLGDPNSSQPHSGLSEITPDEVMDAIAELLGQRTTAAADSRSATS